MDQKPFYLTYDTGFAISRYTIQRCTIHAQISEAYLQKMKRAFGKPYFAKQPIYLSLDVNTLFSGDGMEFSGVF